MKRWLPWLWYGVIFASSCTVIHRSALVSAVPTPERAGFDSMWNQWWWVFVKGWHATEFAVLFLLTYRAMRVVWSSLVWVAIAAALDEFHQTFVPGRGGRATDVLIDLAGAVVAAIIVTWISAPRPSKTLTPSAT